MWKMADQSLALSHAVTFDTLYGVSWSPDGKHLAFGCGDHGDNTVRALEAASGKEILSNGAHGDWALDTAWSVDGSHLVSVGRDMAAKLTEVATQRFIDNITSITPGALRGGLHAVARHPERDEVLLGGADGVPQVYRMHRLTKRVIGDNANLIRRWPALPGRVFGLAWRPDGKAFAAVASGGGNGVLRVLAAEYDPALPEDIKKIVEKEAAGHSPDERKRLEEYLTADTRTLQELTICRRPVVHRRLESRWHPARGGRQPGDRSASSMPRGPGNARFSRGAGRSEVAGAPAAPPAPRCRRWRNRASCPSRRSIRRRSSDWSSSRRPSALSGSTDASQIVVTARLRDGTTVDATRCVAGQWSEPVATRTTCAT
jgi:hypothetical protein